MNNARLCTFPISGADAPLIGNVQSRAQEALDPEVIKNLLTIEQAGAPGVLAELIDLFANTFPTEIEALREAFFLKHSFPAADKKGTVIIMPLQFQL